MRDTCPGRASLDSSNSQAGRYPSCLWTAAATLENRQAPLAGREDGREAVVSALLNRQLLPFSYFGPQR